VPKTPIDASITSGPKDHRHHHSVNGALTANHQHGLVVPRQHFAEQHVQQIYLGPLIEKAMVTPTPATTR